MGWFEKKEKRIYKVTYLVCDCFRYTVFIKAKDIVEIQRIIDKREAPFHTSIISIEEIKQNNG